MSILIWAAVIIATSLFLETEILFSRTVKLISGTLFTSLTLWNVFATCRIFWRVRKINREILAHERRLHGHELSTEQKRKCYKCLAIIAVFVICHIPFLSVSFAMQINKNSNVFYHYLTFTIACMNSSLNPSIHFIASSFVRSKMIQAMRGLRA